MFLCREGVWALQTSFNGSSVTSRLLNIQQRRWTTTTRGLIGATASSFFYLVAFSAVYASSLTDGLCRVRQRPHTIFLPPLPPVVATELRAYITPNQTRARAVPRQLITQLRTVPLRAAGIQHIFEHA